MISRTDMKRITFVTIVRIAFGALFSYQIQKHLFSGPDGSVKLEVQQKLG